MQSISVWAIGEHTVVCLTRVHTWIPECCIWWFHKQSGIMETYHSFCSMVSSQRIDLLQPLEYTGIITGAKYLKRQSSNLAVGTSFLSLLSVLLRLD